jgi:peptidoglycan hydrolase-like protein with peptidoglycan-binding domain
MSFLPLKGFTMIFDPTTLDGIKKEALRLNVEWQALAAVAEVEAGGRPLWDGLCPIRIEGHYFDKRLSGQKRAAAREQGLASPRKGGVTNPDRMADRYAKLDRMKAINAGAAVESCSWGLGQVMGAHWASLGYASVQALMDEAVDSVIGQINLMGRFIGQNGLSEELRRKDWSEFARRYNGKDYRKNNYDVNMASAYTAFMAQDGASVVIAADTTLLIRGDQGAAVSTLKARLTELGFYRGPLDDRFDGGTEIAVMDFQRAARLLVDGKVGKDTGAALAAGTPQAKDARSDRSEVAYVNQQSTRNRRCTVNLEQQLATAVYAVYGKGTQAQIYSGGQARLGTPGSRTGSFQVAAVERRRFGGEQIAPLCL